MASMLVQAGFYREVENLLSRRECQGFLLAYEEVFSGLIEGYVGEFELDRAVLVYERMRGLGLVPYGVSYRALLRYLIEVDAAQLMYHVHEDMINVGIGGIVLDAIHGNKILSSVCRNFGVEEASVFLRDLEGCLNILHSNFNCEEISWDTYNDMLCEMCEEGEVDDAMALLSQMEALGYRPNSASYSCLIASLGDVGRTLEEDVIFQEMVISGGRPKIGLLNLMLRSCLMKGLLDLSDKVLRAIDEMGLERNRRTFEVLIEYYVSAGRLNVMHGNEISRIKAEDELPKTSCRRRAAEDELK
ncbi:hypothetical protein SASPL_103319 [Salvia splendens]|uniref:Pentatricopeptide repeat-containing protein n=1 Tax=Salvia splendens TaxID=180675 RepID=A0A8X8YYK8_SALSN|nr:hypothetical protein SASPL_103319 [Salvia splendens]